MNLARRCGGAKRSTTAPPRGLTALRPLLDAGVTVAGGGDYLDPRLTPLLGRERNGRAKTLSPREREIMGLLSQGLSG